MYKHLRDHWLSDGATSYWPHHPNKDDVIRHGLAEAIDLTDDGKLPICILWICAGHHFQVALHKPAVQVTMTTLTPHTPFDMTHASPMRPTNLLVVGTKREIDEVVREADNAQGRPRADDCTELAKAPGIWKAPIYQE